MNSFPFHKAWMVLFDESCSYFSSHHLLLTKLPAVLIFIFKTKFGKDWLIAALVAYLGERKHNFKSKIWSNSGTASKIDYYLVLRIVKGPVRGSHKGWKCRNQCWTIGEVTANTSFIIPFLFFWFRSELQT